MDKILWERNITFFLSRWISTAWHKKIICTDLLGTVTSLLLVFLGVWHSLSKPPVVCCVFMPDDSLTPSRELIWLFHGLSTLVDWHSSPSGKSRILESCFFFCVYITMVMLTLNHPRGEAIESVEEDASVGSDSWVVDSSNNIFALWYLLLLDDLPTVGHSMMRTPVPVHFIPFRPNILTQNYIVNIKLLRNVDTL